MKSIQLDLFVLFVCFKYSDEIWHSYLKNEDVEQQNSEPYFTPKVNQKNVYQYKTIGQNEEKNCREYYVLVVCQNLVKKL